MDEMYRNRDQEGVARRTRYGQGNLTTVTGNVRSLHLEIDGK